MVLESPLDWKEIKLVNPKRKQTWIFIRGLMLKLKFQYFGYLMWRADLLEKTLMLGKTEGRRRRGRQRMRWLDSSTDSMGMSLRISRRWWRIGKPDVLQSMGVAKSRTRLNDWTTKRPSSCLQRALDSWRRHWVKHAIQAWERQNSNRTRCSSWFLLWSFGESFPEKRAAELSLLDKFQLLGHPGWTTTSRPSLALQCFSVN